MKKRDVKTLLNRVLKDYIKGIKFKEIEEKYNIEIDNSIEDYFFWVVKSNYEGKIEGLKSKDYKVQREIYFMIMEDMLDAWVESKIYNYVENDFEYVMVYEIEKVKGRG